MLLNARLMGRILSVQKILVGGIEQTPEGAVTDGKVTPYILIRGSTGNDAIVDSNGNLVCMLKGDQNLPIAQDVHGNMVAVMKGSEDLIIAQDTSGNMIAAMKGLEGANVRDVAVDSSGNMITILRGAAGNDVAVDASGRLAAMMKGLEGANIRDVAVDSSGQLITIIRGAAGNNVAVDGSGNLSAAMKGLEGANVRDIAVDGSGNMVAVMKGDYEGSLKTWKVDTDGRGEMFISDPSDVWGNVNPMGLGEHAARTHAPPMVFDKRGDILRWIDFESATGKFIASGTGSATYSRTNSTAANGDFSYKMTVGNTEYAYIKYATNDFHLGRLGHQILFATADTDLEIQFWLSYYNGSVLYVGVLSYDFSTGLLKYLANGGAYQTIATLSYYKSIYNFSTMKVVVDFNTNMYVRALVFGNEFDLSSYPLHHVSDNPTKHLESYTRLSGTAAGINTAYIDNIILTENEPVN